MLWLTSALWLNTVMAQESPAAGAEERTWTAAEQDQWEEVDRLEQLLVGRYQAADYAGAADAAAQQRALLGELIGTQAPRYLEACNNVGALYKLSGRVRESLPILMEVLEARRALLGERHKDTAVSLMNLAGVHRALGQYHDAVPLYEEALEILEEQISQADPLYATGLNNLGMIYRELGHFSRALPLYWQALRIQQSARGEEDPHTAVSAGNLASLYRSMGSFDAALPLYRQAAETLARTVGKEHPLYAGSLEDLGGIYRLLGSAEQARSLLQEATAIQREVLGEEHPAYARSMINLSATHADLGEHHQALELLLSAQVILKQIQGAGSPQLAELENNLAATLEDLGQLEEALPHYQEALEILRQTLGERHPSYGMTVTNLALLQQALGETEEAFRLLERALDSLRAGLGVNHPAYTTTLSAYAHLHQSEGQHEEALVLFREVTRAQELTLRQLLTIGSPRQKVAYLKTIRATPSHLLTLSLQDAPESLEAAELALQTLLQRKARSLEAEADTLGQLRSALDEEGLEMLEELKEISSRLERSLRRPAPEDSDGEQRGPDLAALKQQQERLQESLAERSRSLHQATQEISLQRVQAQLPPGSALLEWTIWEPRGAASDSRPRYAVFVLRPEGLVSWLDMGPAAELDQAVQQLRRDIQREGALGFESWGPATRRSAEAAYQQVFRPLESALEGVEQLYLSPDHELYLLPFESLRDAQGRTLGDRFLVTQLSSGRDLLRMGEHPVSLAEPLVFAGVDFGERTMEQGSSGLRSAEGEYYPALEGSAQEGQFLRGLIWGSELIQGAEATEARLKEMQPPSVLHIATHGYFMETEGADVSPLLLSGLVLAGANSGGQEEENGFLSASEFINLDLRGTELVVLSACETGVGGLQVGEGVQGLSKALQVAGSETQVLSLWKVSDEATQILMREFYARLIEGVGRGEALRQAKAALRADPRFEHPFYWAAFVLSGDWRPLETPLGRPSLWQRWRQSRSEE